MAAFYSVPAKNDEKLSQKSQKKQNRKRKLKGDDCDSDEDFSDEKFRIYNENGQSMLILGR